MFSSIPTEEEVKWILERCRSAEPTETVGYRPDLYENWFKKPTGQRKQSEVRSEDSEKEYGWEHISSQDSNYLKIMDRQVLHDVRPEQPKVDYDKALANAEKEILSLLQQEGCRLQPMTTSYSSRRKYSLHDKLEGEQGQEQIRVASFEGLLKKLLKEIESKKQSIKTSEDSDRKTDTISNESNLFRLTQIISSYAETATRKKTASSSVGSGGALEQFRMIGKLLPSLSLTTTKQFPFSYPAPDITSSLDSHKVEHNLSGTMLQKNKSEESMIISTNYETGGSDL